MGSLARSVVTRFMVASGKSSRLDALQEELEALEVMRSDLEDVLFMEETVTTTMHKAQELARKYPDLHGMNRYTQSGLMDFHHRVLADVSRALDELDEAVERRDQEVEEMDDAEFGPPGNS